MTQATATRKSTSNTMTLIAKVARTLGASGRKTLAETESSHRDYLKASEEKQQAMRHVWVAEYMAAYLNIRNDEADNLRQAPRFGVKEAKTVKIDDEAVTLEPRTKVQQQAYDRARKQFDFHIRREGTQGGTTKGKAKKTKIDKPAEAAIVAMCGKLFNDGATKETLKFIAEQAAALAAKYK